MSIGQRLHFVFACILALLLLGSGIALWQFREIEHQIESASLVEQQLTAILRLHNSMLTLTNQLHRAADTRDQEYFAKQVVESLATLRSDTAWASEGLRRMIRSNDREAVILDSLNGLLDSLPVRVQAFVELASSGDWAALHSRLLNQADQTDDVVAALVRESFTKLSEARQQLRDDVGHAQHRANSALAFTGLLSFLFAAFLGVAITRSITHPLADLAAGARALSRGEFGQKVMVTGNDELAHLTMVFNQASRDLKDLYGKLQFSEAHFRSLIENASDLIIVVNRIGEILYASPSTTRVLGYGADALVGRSFQDLLAGHSAPDDRAAYPGNIPLPGEKQAFEVQVRHHDGSTRILEGLSINLLEDPAVSGIVVNALDVSERRRAEQALREREDQLRQAQKLEAIARLAAGIAHNLNNLLLVILGAANLAEDLVNRPQEVLRQLKAVQEASQKAANLVRQLVAYAGRRTLVVEQIDISELVSVCVPRIRASIPERINFILELAVNLPLLVTDRAQLEEVLMNLVMNASEAIADGICGNITIRTGGTIHHSGVTSVTLSVQDDGCGMDEQSVANIFEPFFTTKFLGRGLGLAAVAGIVRSLNGTIDVDSRLGIGSTFRIELPATKAH